MMASHDNAYGAAPPDIAADPAAVAVVGFAGRFPEAASVEAFWDNLCAGVESIRTLSEDELREAGVPEHVLRDPTYVRRSAHLENVDQFDAEFFGVMPREAEAMDPQQRLFLECAWEALEHSGYGRRAPAMPVGVFAGMGANQYLLRNLLNNPARLADLSEFQLALLNDKDFLATQVSYKLGLRGPSLSVQTACSTSLVATHLAYTSLVGYGCDVALAGGATMGAARGLGYYYVEGGIHSPDGHCRAFDEQAGGTISGEGVAVVVLKRLSDALADGDTVYAVLRSIAVNNDGDAKVGYAAPSVDGQAEVIALAHALADVDARTVGYVETHGTGTPLGDPIEVAALKRAFGLGTPGVGYCTLGSVKTNVGHLDAAAGVTGLIKASLALHHGVMPPSLHFSTPNPKLGLESSPFVVGTTLQPWPTTATPRRAGVSSFGIGGTNAHALLEEAPPIPKSDPGRPRHVLRLSAMTETALEAATDRLASALENSDVPLADVAHTLAVGRERFPVRRSLVCGHREEAVSLLRNRTPGRVRTRVEQRRHRDVVFAFPGAGAEHTNMARALYAAEPRFRAELDRCIAAHSDPEVLRATLFPAETPDQREPIGDSSLAHPALVAVEVALARTWISWGIEPAALIGYSLGEYAAACIADVLSIEDALALVQLRGELFATLPPGTMIGVDRAAESVQPMLDPTCAVAGINAPDLCTLSGPVASINDLAERLQAEGADVRFLHVPVAAHSPAIDAILERFARRARTVDFRPPTRPIASSVTGTWAAGDDLASADYWVRHLRQTVRFSEAIDSVLQKGDVLVLESGPGRVLTSLGRLQATCRPHHSFHTSLPHPREDTPDDEHALATLGQLWQEGVSYDPAAYYAGERRRRVPLPTYPFERRRYWIEPQPLDASASALLPASKVHDVDRWLYLPSWRQTAPASPSPVDAAQHAPEQWLLFVPEEGPAAQLADDLAAAGHAVVAVHADPSCRQLEVVEGHPWRAYRFAPDQDGHYVSLLAELEAQGVRPDRIVYAWTTPAEDAASQPVSARHASVFRLIQALIRVGWHSVLQENRSLTLDLVTPGLYDDGVSAIVPESYALAGLSLVVPQELPDLHVRCLDMASVPRSAWLAELVAPPDRARFVAYRGARRWVRSYEPVPSSERSGLIRPQGTYLITGGLGDVGLLLARHLVREFEANVVLMSRSEVPHREAWEALRHDSSDPWLRRRIEGLRRIEEAGGQPMVVVGDVGSEQDVRRVLSEARDRFGRVDGVLHAAAVSGAASSERTLDALTLDDVHEQFYAKVQGARALAAALRGADLDVCVLFSSNAAVLGGLGFGAYAPANAMLDAFAAQQSRDGEVPWISASWDGWPEFPDVEATSGDQPQSSMDAFAMTADEACAAFERVLALGSTPQVVVSTGPLEARRRQWVTGTDPEAEDQGAEPPQYARPSMRVDYVAPRTDTERDAAAIWEDLLGIQDIGVHDNFFELGGHSLLATRLVAKIREAFGLELPLRSLYEATTIEQLADLVDTLRVAQHRQLAVADGIEDDRVDVEL
ncbi:MAG: SDR family NAD(P)-dependent oxidoreductase [Bacteroidota bacterium]